MSGQRQAGFPILGVTALTFAVLKLCHVIDWSWWWVTATLWGPLAVSAVLLLAVILVGAIAALIDYFGEQDGTK